MEENETRFPLADLLSALSDELAAAAERAESRERDQLRLKECSVELGIAIEKKGSGGIQFWVVELGGESTKANTQTLRVTLEPSPKTRGRSYAM